MFGLFKNRKQKNYIPEDAPKDQREKITFHYPNMKPGERIEKLFEELLTSGLDKNGFTFKASKKIFVRTLNGINQEINISKSKWNRSGEVCSFWLGFVITGHGYTKWHVKQYGYEPLNDVLWGTTHNNLKEWVTKFSRLRYNLEKNDNAAVFEEIQHNVENIILPIFNQYCSYETAGDMILEKGEYWLAAKCYDCFLISGRLDKAKITLEQGLKWFEMNPSRKEERLYDDLMRRSKLH